MNPTRIAPLLLLPARCAEPPQVEPIAETSFEPAPEPPRPSGPLRGRKLGQRRTRVNSALVRQRQRHGLSLKLLAMWIGIPEQRLSEIEHQVRQPTWDELQEIASVLDCTPDDLWPGWRETFVFADRIEEVPFSDLGPPWTERMDGLPEELAWEQAGAALWKRLVRQTFQRMAANFSYRDGLLLELLLGLGLDEPVHSWAEIAARLKLSPKYVYQLKPKLLWRLHHPLRSRQLQGFESGWEDLF